jgi:hypothetical protein
MNNQMKKMINTIFLIVVAILILTFVCKDKILEVIPKREFEITVNLVRDNMYVIIIAYAMLAFYIYKNREIILQKIVENKTLNNIAAKF